MFHIKQNIKKFEKLYEIVYEYKNSELLTPDYFKYFKALIYLSGFIHNLFELYKVEIEDEEILDYKNEIEKFYNDSIEIYSSLTYNNEIHEIISNL
jgi:hypothetical protein